VPDLVVQEAEPYGATEESPLLPKARLSRIGSQGKDSKTSSEWSGIPSFKIRVGESFAAGREHIAGVGRSLLNPKNYTKDTAVAGAKASLQTVSAVFLGLLLNILDALSYGYILFPLGSEIFSSTGPDGISIFFVSCIISQLCYSLGLSVFRGGVGSEMIEVVPFFHKMAYSIMGKMKNESNEAVIATVIVAYCLSSIVTGLIFLALGAFKLGNLVNFFPRHILIGCIGGVGFFLVVTGIEVSARIDGNLNYDLDTLHKLFARDTVYLWTLPLILAVIVLTLRRVIKSSFVLPAFFIVIFGVFYLVVKGILRLDLENVRNAGWIFDKPEAGVPFYRFYSYFSESFLASHIQKTSADKVKNLAL
jgi:SulP family sulfate permease